MQIGLQEENEREELPCAYFLSLVSDISEQFSSTPTVSETEKTDDNCQPCANLKICTNYLFMTRIS